MGVQDTTARPCMSRAEQNNGTMHIQYFSTRERRHIPGGNCLSSVFKCKYLICCSQAGVLRHGEGRASGQAIPHTASHSLTSGLDRNALFPSLQPKPHCLNAVLININQMWWNWPNIYCKKGDYCTHYKHSCNVMWMHRLGLCMHVCAGT